MKHDSEILKQIKSYFMRRKSADEAHAFEKKVEKDAFLYEAMEGFEGMITSDIQQAMDELDDRLDSQSNRFLFTYSWKIAARIAAVLTVGLSLYFTVFNSSSNENAVSSNDDEIYEPRNGETQFDTLGTYAFQYQEQIESTDSSSQIDDLDNTYALNDESPIATPMPQAEQNAMATNEPRLKEESTSSNNWEEESVSDENAIALNEGDASAAEVLEKSVMETNSADQYLEQVSGVMSEKSEMKKSAPMVPVKAKEKGLVASPKDGMPAYQSYLKKNLNTSEGMPTGAVILSFEIDRNGKPKKIVIVKSLCTACDAEAIRVLENGPAWAAEDKNTKGTVAVQFP